MLALLALAAAAASPQPEMALRCAVVEGAPLLARNAATLGGKLSGGPAPTPVMRPLPQMMVDGWSVEAMPIAQALGQLGPDAGFVVEADPGLSPVSWKGGATPLPSLVARLAQSAGGVPSFDGRVLRISKPVAPAPWRFERPAGRDATLALLDALRGYGATEVALSADAVTFQASSPVVARIRKGLTAASSVIAFDVWTYRIPATRTVDWKSLDTVAPVSERHPVGSGGRFVVGYVTPEAISTFLGGSTSATPLGSQTVAGPQGWAMEVPLTQCAVTPGTAGSAMLKPAWSGQTMSVEISGTALDAGRVDAVAPGSSMIVTGPSAGGARIVALIRPRVLVAR